MRWFIPKTFLKWREPQVVRQTRETLAAQAEPWCARPVGVLLIAAMLLVTWFLGTLNPKNQPPPFMFALVLSIPVGMLYVYVLPLMYRLVPSEVRVTDRWISRTVGNHPQFLQYPAIRSCTIIVQGHGVERVALLEIGVAKSSHVIGIAPEVSLEELAEVLGGRGLEVVVQERV